MNYRKSKKQNAGEILQEEIDQGLFNYKITNSENIVAPVSEKVVSGSLSNFLPERALIRVELGIRKIAAQIEQVIEAIRVTVDGEIPVIPVNWEEKLSKEVLQFIGEIRHEVNTRERDYINILLRVEEWKDSPTINELTTFIERLVYGSRKAEEGDQLMEDLARRLREAVLDLSRDPRLADQEIELEAREFPHPYSTVIQQIRRVFRNQIFYLGPLRDDPRAIYGMPPLPNQRDVGLKGEYTAAMLDIHKKLIVSYPEPPELGKKFNGRYRRPQVRLITAVQKWLQRMGLAQQFKTKMTSKVGYQLEVRPEGVKQNLDLTSLGVGVSQVLPAIVMGLLAPKDSVLIFEQPEVHLHPKVQSVLRRFLSRNCSMWEAVYRRDT